MFPKLPNFNKVSSQSVTAIIDEVDKQDPNPEDANDGDIDPAE